MSYDRLNMTNQVHCTHHLLLKIKNHASPVGPHWLRHLPSRSQFDWFQGLIKYIHSYMNLSNSVEYIRNC